MSKTIRRDRTADHIAARSARINRERLTRRELRTLPSLYAVRASLSTPTQWGATA